MSKRKKYFLVIIISLFLLSCSIITAEDIQSDNKDTRPVKNVAVLVYNGVEILDFAGPVEVFEIAGLFRKESKYQTNVYTIAVSEESIISQNCVTVVPGYTFDKCPEPDIVVLPGGMTGEMRKNKNLLNWLEELEAKNKVLMSVCTGAFILSEAHLLDGKEATTWYGQIENLRKKTPKATIHSDVRFVDNGNIITTAGVSAGIDGALHIVDKMFGKDAAKNVVKYMQYDKWVPNEGLIVQK